MEQQDQELLNIFRNTTEFDARARQKAEQTLRELERKNHFGPILLRLLSLNVEENIKLSMSIYLKNFIKTYWGHEQQIISDQDCDAIKLNIIPLMLLSPSSICRQLSESISLIASHDFYEKWKNLLPALTSKLKENNFEQIYGVLSIIESITSRYVDKEKNAKMVDEIKYIMNIFSKPWLDVLQSWQISPLQTFNVQVSNKPSLNSQQIKSLKFQILSLEMLVTIFYDLNTVDLIEFFEETMKTWVPIFQRLLMIDDKFNVFETPNDTPGPIDSLRTILIKSLKLFVTHYEDESNEYTKDFLQVTVILLSNVNKNERYDELVAESTSLIQSIARQSWNKKLFDSNKLNHIVSKILIRNICLRETDMIMYETNGEDWVRRDMEGSDLYTRRRGAIELIRTLTEHWPQEISLIVKQHIDELLNNYEKNHRKNFVDFDTSINLFLSVNIIGSTKAFGATKLLGGNNDTQYSNFFGKYLLPYLTNKIECPHPIILSDCIKYIILYRSKWNFDMFCNLLQVSCIFLNHKDYVLHTYAAMAVDRMLSLQYNFNNDEINDNRNQNYNKNEEKIISNNNNKMTYKFPKENLIRIVDKILPLLFQIFEKFEESQTNEYVMKAVMRVVVRVEEGLIKLIEPLLQSLKKLLFKVSQNLLKPTFNHYMFEVIAATIHYICNCNNNNNNNNNNEHVQQFEQLLMPAFQNILSKDNCIELHPYVYQIINLMLRIRNHIDNNYETLFDRLLKTELWIHEGNIIAISSMFSDYLRIMNEVDKKEDFINVDNERRLTGMLGIFQSLLSKKIHDVYAFRVLRAIFEYVSKDKIDKYMNDILKLIFYRIKDKKAPDLCSNFIVCLSIFIVRHGFSTLVGYCNNIQQDIFASILEKVWLEYARHVNDLTDRKIVTIAMIGMFKDPRFFSNNNNKFMYLFPKIIQMIISIFEIKPIQSSHENDTNYYLMALEEQGAGSKFSGLNFIKHTPNDITKQMGDPRKLFVEALIPIFKNDKKFTLQICQHLDKKYIKSFDEYCSQFNIDFSLSS